MVCIWIDDKPFKKYLLWWNPLFVSLLLKDGPDSTCLKPTSESIWSQLFQTRSAKAPATGMLYLAMELASCIVAKTADYWPFSMAPCRGCSICIGSKCKFLGIMYRISSIIWAWAKLVCPKKQSWLLAVPDQLIKTELMLYSTIQIFAHEPLTTGVFWVVLSMYRIFKNPLEENQPGRKDARCCFSVGGR